MSNQAKKKRISNSGTLFAYFGPPEKEKEKENQERDILYKERNDGDNTQNPEDQMNDEGQSNGPLGKTAKWPRVSVC